MLITVTEVLSIPAPSLMWTMCGLVAEELNKPQSGVAVVCLGCWVAFSDPGLNLGLALFGRRLDGCRILSAIPVSLNKCFRR